MASNILIVLTVACVVVHTYALQRSESSDALCALAADCSDLENASDNNNLKTVETLLQVGANPNSECPTRATTGCLGCLVRPTRATTVFGLLVRRSCSRMLNTTMSLEGIKHPLDVNAVFTLEKKSGTALDFVLSSEWWSISILTLLLENPKTDMNSKLHSGLSAVGSLTSMYPAHNIYLMFWLRPDLDDEQRELLLNRWSRQIRFATEQRWLIRYDQKRWFGSKTFAQHYLDPSEYHFPQDQRRLTHTLALPRLKCLSLKARN